MWYALRAELAYSRPFVLGGLGMAVGVVTVVSLVFAAVGDGPPSHAADGIRGMFLVMGPTVAGFIVQAYRSQERRARLLLAGPLTPRQIAVAAALLSAILFGIGVLAAGLVMGAGSLARGKLEIESLHMVGYVGGLMLMMQMMGLAAQEAAAARRQRRPRAAAAGWAVFVAAMLFLAALDSAAFYFQGPLTWMSLHLGNLIVAAAAAAVSVELYAGRTDFTR